MKERICGATNRELENSFGDLDLSFIRINKVEWIGHMNRMDTDRNQEIHLEVDLRIIAARCFEVISNILLEGKFK